MSATLDGSVGASAAGAQAGGVARKGTYVNDMKAGSSVDGYYVVVDKRREPARYKDEKKKGLYFFFEIGDKTGTTEAKYWGGDKEDETRAVYQSFNVGDVIAISKGSVKLWNGKLEVAISVRDNRASVVKIDKYDKTELIQPGEKDVDEMIKKLHEVIESVRNQGIKTALKAIFDDKMIAEFSAAPAAVRYHHGYAGGLLEHSLSMAAIARAVAEQHGEGLDGDLLVAGCLLHDIGKTRGYKIGATIDRTDGEIMFGHIPVGARIVWDAMAGAEGIPDAVRDKLVHMVLSHHGALEKGSPVEPLFPEAMALHKIDDCDAQVKHAVTERRAAAAAAAGGAGSALLVRGEKGRGYVYLG